MTATLYAFPGCSIDTEEDHVSDADFAREHVDHPPWCERINDWHSDSGLVVHRGRTGGPDEVPIFAHRADEANGSRQSWVAVGDDVFSPAEVRALIKALWAAHDHAGGAR